MADNIAVSEGSGKSVRTDDVGGQQVQIIKVATGGDGVATEVSTSDPFPVSVQGTVTVGSHAVTNAGTFAVQATVAAGATNIAKAEDAASASADVGVPAMAIQVVSPTDLAGTAGDYAMLQMSGGRLLVDTGSVTVGNSVTTVIESFTPDANNIIHFEDEASGSGDAGVPALAVRKATPANTSGADGDYENLQMSSGRLWVDPSGVTLTVASHAVTNAGTFAVQGTAKGTTAADAALSDAPVTVGGRATNTNLAKMSADGDVVNTTMSMQGAVVVTDGPRELLAVQQTQISNSTSETTIVTAGGAGIFNDVYGILLANTGASTTKVTIKDATAGTTRCIIEVPTLDTRGFMVPASSAIPQAAAAENWTATCGTATTALEVTVLYIKHK